MAKKKEKVKLFEKVEISGPEFAKELYEKESKKFKFRLVCTIAALIATLIFILFSGPLSSLSDIAVIETVSIVIYVGGLLCTLLSGPVGVLKLFLKAGKFCYWIVPFILFDLIFFVIGLAVALIAFCVAPVIFAAYNLYQSYLTKKDAQEFLALADIVQNNEQSV